MKKKMSEWMNPVLIKEYQWRMRKKTTPWIIFSYLVGLGVLIFFTILFNSPELFRSVDSRIVLSTNANLLNPLSYFQLCLVAFVLPAITAGSISMEREKQTLSLLLVTTLSSKRIIWGKWFPAVSFMLLLVFSTLPLYMLIYSFGGISLGTVFNVFLHLLVTMLFLSSVGIFCSTVIKRTAVATVVTYLVVMLWGVGSVILAIMLSSILELMFDAFFNPISVMPILLKIFAALHPAVSMAMALDLQAVGKVFGDSMLLYYGLYLAFYLLLAIMLLRGSAYFLLPKRDQQAESAAEGK